MIRDNVLWLCPPDGCIEELSKKPLGIFHATNTPGRQAISWLAKVSSARTSAE